MALVSQEPVLFNTTIFENIVYGLDDEEAALISRKDLAARVEAAAIEANVHGFVVDLPRGYQTMVGEKGLQLSGGQRQRICIARAIIKNPQILLLDEATSALDVEAERLVQSALATAVKNRTTIVIAHRLSTIRDADNIVVMAQGRIIEQGTHNMLMALGGQYTRLVERQRLSGENETNAAFADRIDRSLDNDLPGEKELQVIGIADSVGQKTERTGLPCPYQEDFQAATPKTASPWSSLTTAARLIGQLNHPEMILILAAIVLAILAGLSVPAYVYAKWCGLEPKLTAWQSIVPLRAAHQRIVATTN